jgi:periplasmic protein TonB
MSLAITQTNIDPIQALLRFVNSEQFYAFSTTILLHLMVVVLLLAGWVSNKPPEPDAKTIKVQIMMQPAALLVPQATPQVMPETPSEPKVKEISNKIMTEKAVAESQFAKKRVEDTPKIEVKNTVEPMPQVSVDTTEKAEKDTEAKLTENSEASKKDSSKPNTSSESSESAASSSEKNFDVSQYFPVKKDAPVYPQRALDKGVQGSCTVQYNVNAQGQVENPEALSDCHAFFIKPSLEATKSFRYTPRMLDGKAVKVSNVKNTFQYRIE